MQGFREVLDFWFGDQARARWFEPTPEFDQLVRERFGPLVARAARGDLKAWEATPEGALALCILLDQMPRNIFRGEARAYATDEQARAVAERALEQGFDGELAGDQKQFIYLPFMHSETFSNQLRCLALFEAAGLLEGRRHAEDHVDVIRRFGRFPHRNAALGRASTPEEEAFLRTSSHSWGQASSRAQASAPGFRPRQREEP
jgi:uncharacterized protein (DUF924 family)